MKRRKEEDRRLKKTKNNCENIIKYSSPVTSSFKVENF